MPRCFNCKSKFEQYEFNNKFCKELDCQVKKGLWKVEQSKKKWKKEKAKRKKELMTLQDWLKICQTHFNKYIRLRDKGNNCISCNKPAKKENAGHYRSVGGNPELRFNEENVYLQCEFCNSYQHGNLIEYRKNLVKKIGLERVEWLEGKHEPKKYNTGS